LLLDFLTRARDHQRRVVQIASRLLELSANARARYPAGRTADKYVVISITRSQGGRQSEAARCAPRPTGGDVVRRHVG